MSKSVKKITKSPGSKSLVPPGPIWDCASEHHYRQAKAFYDTIRKKAIDQALQSIKNPKEQDHEQRRHQ